MSHSPLASRRAYRKSRSCRITSGRHDETFSACLLSLLLTACSAPSSAPDAGSPFDFGALDAGPPDACTAVPTSQLDLLLVVDGDFEAQAALGSALPHLVNVLTTGDLDGDGTMDAAPFVDIHVGVVTVDMGVAGIPDIPSCTTNPDFGDDGILLTTPGVGGSGCMATYPRFLAFTGGAAATQFAADAACLARTGSGCGFQQQLDAPLKALLPSSSPVTFHAGTHGHGDDPSTNGGFLRTDSVVAILVLTDEDDCSTDVTDIWNPMSSTHTGNLNLRCINYSVELYPIDRFVTGFRSLRPTNPGRVVYLAIAGIPEELVTLATPADAIDYPRLFDDPRVMNHITVTGGTSTLDPGCESTGRGAAAPGIRMAQVAQGMGAAGLVQSICAADYAPALDGLVSRIVAARGGSMGCGP